MNFDGNCRAKMIATNFGRVNDRRTRRHVRMHLKFMMPEKKEQLVRLVMNRCAGGAGKFKCSDGTTRRL